MCATSRVDGSFSLIEGCASHTLAHTTRAASSRAESKLQEYMRATLLVSRYRLPTSIQVCGAIPG